MSAVLANGDLVVRSRAREAVVSCLALDGPVTVGSWVLVHAGFALGTVSPDDAAATADAVRVTAEGRGEQRCPDQQ